MPDDPKTVQTPQTPPAQGAGTPNQPPAGNPPAGSDPAPKKPEGGTIYSDMGVDEPKPGSWPTDWREQMLAGLDPKVADQFKRFQSPADIAKSYLAAQQRIRSGEYKRAAPPSDNPEELKAWRTEQDIPDSPDGYEIGDAEAMKSMTEEEKADFNVLREGFLAANLPRGTAKLLAESAMKMAAQQQERMAAADATNSDTNQDALRAEWGAEYRQNIKMNGDFMVKHFGEEGMDQLITARMPNGMRLADMPQFNKFINEMARLSGGDVLFDGDVSGGKSLDARLEEIRQVMRTDFNKYQREGLAKEFEQLVAKKEARGGK